MEIGQHWFRSFNLLGFQLHAHLQVILSCRAVCVAIAGICLLFSNYLELGELFFDFIRRIADSQHSRLEWVPLLGTFFLFIFCSNWLGALIPWKDFVHLPNSSMAAPTNDVNVTVALALIVSFAYFYAGIKKFRFRYWSRYVNPYPFLFPLKVLEDFTKPLSLSFRLFRNILADELVVAVLVSLVPLVIPVPLILLGLFTSAIQALIFTTLAANYIREAKEEVS